jgi:phosphatidylinositol alpha-mannosyltransferase
VRVAVVAPYDLDVVGGVQSHVHELARRLVAAGDDVLVLGPGTPVSAVRADGPAVVRVGRSLGVPANGSRAPLALAPAAASRVRAALRAFRPDVVQVHEPLVPAVGPAAALAGVAPTVLTFHAHASGGALPMLARAARPLGRALVRRAAALTAVSDVAAAFHAGVLGIGPAGLQVVPNGVDTARFAAERTRPVDAPPTLLFVGRLEPRKGADLALAAFARLAATRPVLRLRMVGAGPLEADLRRRLSALPADVAGRVDLLGRVPQDRLPAELVAADVALVPSRGGESFGIVLLELMAAGTPTVASDLEAYRAVARPDREALLVPVDDDTALAAAVGRLLDDPALADRLADAGRARALTFDWDRVAAATRAVLATAARPPASR